MKNEKEIREQIKDFDNQDKNFRFLADKTGNKEFVLKAMEMNVGKNVLKWVLDEFDFSESIITIENKE